MTMSSTLRKRVLGDSKPEEDREDSPEKAEEVRLAPVSKIRGHKDNHKHKNGGKRRNGLVFFLGGLFGIVAAGFFAKNSDLIELPDLGMESLFDALPSNFVKDARDLLVR